MQQQKCRFRSGLDKSIWNLSEIYLKGFDLDSVIIKDLYFRSVVTGIDDTRYSDNEEKIWGPQK